MTTPRPLLSIVILTWNTADVTRRCVETIKKHLKTVSYEIIVADNGSTDETAQIIPKISGITYQNTGANLGFAKGNNFVVPQTKGQYLLFLNSDMELLDDTLSQMVTFLDSHPTIGAIGPKFLNIDHTPQGSVFPPQTPLNAFKEFWLEQPAYSKYVPPKTDPIAVWSISGGAFLIRRQLFLEIGGWDEKYFMFFEDMELCRQIHRRGFQIYFFPGCQVVHRHGASGQHLAPSATQWHRLIPSSIKYHGYFQHYLINFIIWSGQKCHALLSRLKKS